MSMFLSSRKTERLSSLPGFACTISLNSFAVAIALPLTSSILSLTCAILIFARECLRFRR